MESFISSPVTDGGGGRAAAGGGPAKAACHSDYVDDDEARKIQRETLVQVDVRPALGIGKEDRVI